MDALIHQAILWSRLIRLRWLAFQPPDQFGFAQEIALRLPPQGPVRIPGTMGLSLPHKLYHNPVLIMQLEAAMDVPIHQTF